MRGITIALGTLAPIAGTRIENAPDRARERDCGRVILDARLLPHDKLRLRGVATAELDTIAPRPALPGSLDQAEAASVQEPRARSSGAVDQCGDCASAGPVSAPV